VLRNLQPRYEILSEESMEVLERGWRRLASEIGVEFLSDFALDAFRAAGQTVEDRVVRFDPDFLLEQLALAPREFTLRARNPLRSLTVGGDWMVFAPTAGPPFVREGDARRDGTLADLDRFVRLTQTFSQLDMCGPVCEPNDRPLDSRHLDIIQTFVTRMDKPFMGGSMSGTAAADTIAMSEIVFGGREEIEREAVVYAVINVNSPLRYDDRMLDAMVEYVAANQPVVLTPFLLMGAMSPVTIGATLVQQTTEVLAGVALAQLIRPGAPVVFGSFLSNTDMQSGSPGFGGPESALGLLCSGQIARRFGIPWRAGGGFLTSSQTVDAQAAYESLNTMLPALLAGANYVQHSAGWLESGLVASYEKFIVDIEMLRMLEVEFTPLEIDEASLAFGAHAEVGAGGHFLGAAHTLERFRECFYRPLLSSTENYERWASRGGLDAAARAGVVWTEQLERWEEPPMDADLTAELAAFVDRRRKELGD
jgi:trimethylamine--corrinoid protein Co-methyltransferase